MERIEYDGKKLDELVKRYSGAVGGHLAVIVNDKGKRQISVGGRADLVGMTVSEALARMVSITPGLDETFLDAVCETAKEILNGMNESAGPLQ